MANINLRRLFLYLTIASVAVSAVIGIVVMIVGNFGEFETKVLLTALNVTVTSILGLACGASLEAGRGRILPWAGIAFAVVSAVLWMIMIWAGRVESDVFVESVMSVTLLALACAHLSLLSLATLDRRFLWSRIAAHVVVWSLTALILVCIWADIDPSEPLIARTMGVLAILVGALTVITPVFHKLSSAPSQDGTAAIDAEIESLSARIEELKQRRSAMLHRGSGQ